MTRGALRLLAFLALTLTAAQLSAQSHTLDLRALEIDQGGRRAYHNLIYAFAPGDGRVMAEFSHLRLPRDDYYENSLGAGYRFVGSRAAGVYLLAHYARASDRSDYIQPALLAFGAIPRWNAAAFVLHYIPISPDGFHQWLLDPLDIQYQIGGPFIVGLSAYYWRPQGGPDLVKVGGQAGVVLGKFTPLIAVRRTNVEGRIEFQFRVLAVF